MSMLCEFRVLADFPDGSDMIEVESAISEAIDKYLAARGLNHATTLVSTTPDVTVLERMAGTR